jgi:Ca-activated chloride channel family protein
MTLRTASRLLLTLATAAAGVAAQEPIPQFSSRTQLVEVYATVTDASGEPVTGLRREDFEVFEDGRRQDVTAFAAGEFPLVVALGVDRSWSMRGEPLVLARRAAQSFLRVLRPSDRPMVLAIGSEAEVIAPLSADRESQLTAVAALDPWSTTALHDAILAALDRIEAEPGRQALIVFSDGSDRYSQATAAEVVDRARRSTALVYPIVIGNTRPTFPAELASVSGGRSFQIKDARQLDETLATIARELRHQYLLGYTPSEPIVRGKSEWRSIRVSLRNPRSGVRIRARDGYSTE